MLFAKIKIAVIFDATEAAEQAQRRQRTNTALVSAGLPIYVQLSQIQQALLDNSNNFGQLLRTGRADMPLTDETLNGAVQILV